MNRPPAHAIAVLHKPTRPLYFSTPCLFYAYLFDLLHFFMFLRKQQIINVEYFDALLYLPPTPETCDGWYYNNHFDGLR